MITRVVFHLANVADDEVIIVARLHLMYNGEHSSKECALCFNDDDCVEVDDRGFAFHQLAPGYNTFTQIRCTRDSSAYHHVFNRAFVARRGTVTYFGDLYVVRKTDGGYKSSQLFGLAGALADESSDDGEAKLTVVSRPKPTFDAFAAHVRQNLPGSVSLLGSARSRSME